MSCNDHDKDAPDGYIQWHMWAKDKAKTHKQIKCPECGSYKIWVKKKQKEQS